MVPGSSEDDLAVELEGARRVVESHFLSAGETLTRSIEGVDALVASLENLVKALDDKAVAATTTDMRKAATTLLALSDNHKNRQRAIEQLGGHRENLARCVGDMRSSLAYMRAFTVNIKIVSAGIALAGSTFESFAQEISDCIETGRIELRELEEEISGLQSGLSAAAGEGKRLASQLSILLPALPDELSECAGQMGQHFGRLHTTAGEVAGIARNIHQRVVRVLQALQIGDITRQRIEHVQSGIQDVAGLSDPKLAALGYALLDRQLQATKAEFDLEITEIEKAMADMASHSRDLLKMRDMAYGNGGKGQSFLHNLLARIEEAEVLVREVEGADSSVLKTGQETAAAAEQLGTRINAIQSLKNDVQYMALNTTIKCAQIGEAARPLSVIAIELRDHGRHLETAAASGLSELDGLTAAAGSLTSTGEDRDELSATAALKVVANLVREACRNTEQETAVLVSKGEEVLAILDESVEQLAFHAEIGGILETVAQEMAVLAANMPNDAAGLEGPLAELLAGMHVRYTMKQEREVHQDFAEWLGLSATSLHAAVA